MSTESLLMQQELIHCIFNSGHLRELSSLSNPETTRCWNHKPAPWRQGSVFLKYITRAISLVFDQNTTGSYLFYRFQYLQSLPFICCRTTENSMTTSEKELICSYSDHFHYYTVQTCHLTETKRFEERLTSLTIHLISSVVFSLSSTCNSVTIK